LFISIQVFMCQSCFDLLFIFSSLFFPPKYQAHMVYSEHDANFFALDKQVMMMHTLVRRESTYINN